MTTRRTRRTTKRKPDAFSFNVTVSVDSKTGDVEAVYFQVREGKAVEVRELADGAAFVNYGKDGKLLGIELLAPCSITVLDAVAQEETISKRSQVRRFFRQSVPRDMVAA